MKNSNDTIGNRTRDPSACSAVPQPIAPPRAPYTSFTATKFNKTLSGQKPRQVADRRVTRTEMVLETLVHSSFIHLVRPLARESSIEILSQFPFPVWSRLGGQTNSAATEECIIELHTVKTPVGAWRYSSGYF